MNTTASKLISSNSRPRKTADKWERTADNFGTDPARCRRVAGTILLVMLSITCWTGCAALHPIGGIPASYLPHELKSPSRSGKRTIDLSLLKQSPVDEYLIDTGDVLGIYIEGVLGDRTQVPPVHFPQAGESVAPALGFPIPVRDDGTISLPMMKSPLNVRGMTLSQIEQSLRRSYTVGVGQRILNPNALRILVSLLKPREYAVLVIRQEGFGATGTGGAGAFNLGNLKEGSGQVVNLPAYKNDVLHALAKTGGLPGTDAENTIYIIRSRRNSKSRFLRNRNQPTPANIPRTPGTGAPLPSRSPDAGGAQQPWPPNSMMPNNGEPLNTTFINPPQYPPVGSTGNWNGFQPAQVIQDGAIIQQIGGSQMVTSEWRGSPPTSHSALIQPAYGQAWGHSQVSAPIPPTPDPVSQPEPPASPAKSPANSIPPQTPAGQIAPNPALYPQTARPPVTMSGGDWYASNMYGGGEPTVDNPRVVKIPIRLAAGENVHFTEEDIILEKGDIVFIESRETEIFYTGGLLGGGQYTLPRDYDLDVLGAISIGQGGGGGQQGQSRANQYSVGGFSALNQDVSISASDCVILRQMPNGTQVPIKVDLYRALRHPEDRVLIQPGDYIILQYTRLEAVGAFFERYLLEPLVFGVAASQLTNNNNNN